MKGGEFAELTAFMAVFDDRSFRKAATRLGVSPSALSRTVRALEDRLGVRLLNRTTRSVAPTEAGLALVDRMRPAMAELDSAVQEAGARQGQPRGLVRLNLPRIAARLILTPLFAEFFAAYPDIRFDLVIDDSLTDVVARGFDAGIRSGALVHQDMIALRLTPDLRMAVVASPDYFSQRPPPRTPLDLHDHVGVTYRWSESGALYRWIFEGPHGPIEMDIKNRITVNETDLILAAALEGVGVAFLPESFVAPWLQTGKLVRVLEDWCKPFPGFHIYYPSRRQMPEALRAFIDFVRTAEP
ncbi:LysR family transcriptional regulator [Brevundimonas sp. PWP3-1b1]|uniref:LysR family transcriptional regulator n=1 Tax=unclassified Brevundimonas TaxID=2622653 RepID=UPI003CEC017F